jgi:CubicO group peptidase (beta-lactamase class C family)
MKQNVIDVAGLNSTTYRREYIQELGRVNDIAVLYRTDEKGVWTPQADNWKGSIPPRNFSSYVIGTNGAVFSPMGGMYSTVRDLTEYINVIRRKGLCTNGQRVMQSASGAEMLRLRYRYHGSNKATSSSENSYNAYGLGIQSTTYDPYDEVFPHVVVRGHWGDSYGLISEYEFAENYSFVYAINGAKDGYHPSENSFYEVERRLIHSYIYEYLYN